MSEVTHHSMPGEANEFSLHETMRTLLEGAEHQRYTLDRLLRVWRDRSWGELGYPSWDEFCAAKSPFGSSSNRRTPARYVYFIQHGVSGPIKIGSASDPVARLGQLQTGNPVQLRLLAMLEGGEVQERALHRQFRGTQVTGEWFEPTAELVDFIKSKGEEIA